MRTPDRRPRPDRLARPGQATVEVALVMVAIVACLTGLLVVHRVIDARLQAETLAREVARVMGEAGSYEQALAAGGRRLEEVAAGLSLERDRRGVAHAADPAFARGSVVSVTVSYQVPLGGLTPGGLGEPTVSATARQPVQLFGSRPG
jgi:hypothetical protein